MDDLNKAAFEEATDFCEAKFQNVQIVFNFASKHLDAISSVFPQSEFGFRDSCIKGLWYRVYGWLESLTKLNSPKDYQAFAAANRGYTAPR